MSGVVGLNSCGHNREATREELVRALKFAMRSSSGPEVRTYGKKLGRCLDWLFPFHKSSPQLGMTFDYAKSSIDGQSVDALTKDYALGDRLDRLARQLATC